MKKNFAFTLAEVLITLAIIGVVAAMTLPTLVNKYQDRVNETRYKKALSMLSQAVQLSMAEVDSPGNMTNTDLWACKDKDDFDESHGCFVSETKKLFKNIVQNDEAAYDRMAEVDYGEIDNPWSNSDNLMELFTTGDGITFGYLVSDDGITMLVDTNGASKPNNISKDLYLLQILPNGKVVDVTASLAEGGSSGDCFDNLNSCTQEQCEALPEFGCTRTDRSEWGVLWYYGRCAEVAACAPM